MYPRDLIHTRFRNWIIRKSWPRMTQNLLFPTSQYTVSWEATWGRDQLGGGHSRQCCEGSFLNGWASVFQSQIWIFWALPFPYEWKRRDDTKATIQTTQYRGFLTQVWTTSLPYRLEWTSPVLFSLMPRCQWVSYLCGGWGRCQSMVLPMSLLLWLEILRDERFQAQMAEFSYLNSTYNNVSISSVSCSSL